MKQCPVHDATSVDFDALTGTFLGRFDDPLEPDVGMRAMPAESAGFVLPSNSFSVPKFAADSSTQQPVVLAEEHVRRDLFAQPVPAHSPDRSTPSCPASPRHDNYRRYARNNRWAGLAFTV